MTARLQFSNETHLGLPSGVISIYALWFTRNDLIPFLLYVWWSNTAKNHNL